MLVHKSARAALALAIALASAVPAFAAGAIAVDDEKGQSAKNAGYGVGWGDSREEAARNAMSKCRSAGNDSCKVTVRFDVCGAYVSNRTTYGVGWGDSEADATAMAMGKCGRNCRVVVATCE